MKVKKVLLTSLLVLPLLLSCSTSMSNVDALSRAENLYSNLENNNFKEPEKFQIENQIHTRYNTLDKTISKDAIYVVDLKNYKFYSHEETTVKENKVSTKTFSETWYWLDSSWKFHSAVKDNTSKKHEEQSYGEKFAKETFDLKLTEVLGNVTPVAKTKLELTNIIEYLKDTTPEDERTYEYIFKQTDSDSLYTEKERQIFEVEDVSNVYKEKLAIEDGLVNSWSIFDSNSSRLNKSKYTYTIGNVSVKLPDVSKF